MEERIVSFIEDPEDLTQKLLEVIHRRAIETWGEKRWVIGITEKYCEIYQRKGDTNANVSTRRRNISRVFEVWNCQLETAVALALCVGCRIQMECHSIKIVPIR